MEKKLKAVVKEPGKEAEVKEIEISLKSLQKIVNGMIEIVGFPGLENVDIVLNEEGKLTGEKPNIYLIEYEDILVGTFAVIGYDEEEGDHISLTEEQTKVVLDYVKANDVANYKEEVEIYNKYNSFII